MSKARIIIAAALVIGWAPKDKPFWEAKPYDSWTQKECEKLLTDSPWTERYVIGEYGVNIKFFTRDGIKQSFAAMVSSY